MNLKLETSFFFFDNSGCPGQLTRTTTNLWTHWTPCKPSRQVRHRGDDRHAHWGLNSGSRGRETLPVPLATSLGAKLETSCCCCREYQCSYFFLLPEFVFTTYFSCKLSKTYIITQEGEKTHRNNQSSHTTSLYII